MAGITGIGSGMDIDSMVSAMVNAERAPKEAQLTRVEKKSTTQLSSLGQLKGAISNFQSALATLNSPSSFLARKTGSSDTAVLTGTASSSAIAGTYKLEVQQLASGSKVASAAIAGDSQTKLGTGTLTVNVGDTSLAISVDASNNTLAGVRDAINAAGSGSGLSATIVTDDLGARLVLSSTKTGEGNDITVVADETGLEAGASSLNELAYSGPSSSPDPSAYPGGETDPAYLDALAAYEKGGKSLATAQSAKFTIDGLSVTRDSNTVSDVVEGLEIALKAEGSSTLTVEQDKAGVEDNIQKFVEAYNTLMNFINTETKVTSVGENDTPVTGGLVGDSTVRALVNTVRAELSSPQGQGSLRALADMGVTTQRDGTLAVESSRLSEAVSADFEGVAAYFTGDTGLASRLSGRLSPYTDAGGILESRTDALEASIDKVDKQRTELQTRMTALQERLYKQFNAMDSLVAQLTSTSDSLTQIFNNLPGFVTTKD